VHTHEFSTTLLEWYLHKGRDLPWRASRDPYAIWLSEVILQQTRVEQGCVYWERFLQRWPTVQDLARATEDEVLREWQGLGYYSRARHLYAAACQITALGYFPNTYAAIRCLPGVGAYTAAAIASLAFGFPYAAVDGNVYRVLARRFGIDTPIDTTGGKHTFAVLAQELLPTDRAADFNSAMMDFGATQCTPQSPQCEVCPLLTSCVAQAEGRVSELPVKSRRTRVKERRMTYIYIRCEGYTAIRQRRVGDIWAGLWELVQESDLGGLPSDCRCICKDVRHVLTHRVILADFYLFETEERPCLPPDFRWIRENEIDGYGLPRLIEKLINCL